MGRSNFECNIEAWEQHTGEAVEAENARLKAELARFKAGEFTCEMPYVDGRRKCQWLKKPCSTQSE